MSRMDDESTARLERLTSMLRRRGIILPAFEIHGGAAGLYDFGPLGGRIRNRVNQAWLEHWLEQGDIVEINCPTITPYPVLEASGHVGEFSDFMTICGGCQESLRADTLLEGCVDNPDALSRDELESALQENKPACPACKVSDWGPVKAQNLMFNTRIGAGRSGRDGFIRPETAQGMFTNFPSLYRHFRQRLPFGAVQVGKGYRNEISPRQGMIRLREFNMAELEYFIDPDIEPDHDLSVWREMTTLLVPDGAEPIEMTIPAALESGVIRHATVAWFMARTHDLLTSLGIDPERLRFRQHESTEMAHYASDCWDAEIHGSYGWIECVGIAHRGCYDLQAHEEYTGQRLKAWRAWPEPKQIETTIHTLDPATGGPVFRQLAGSVKAAIEAMDESPDSFPFSLTLDSGETVELLEEHVKVEHRSETVNGEWFTPHVVEPAFGIDRIIWHLLDHAWHETTKNDEDYAMLRLDAGIAAIDAAVLPLFEKDGMDEIADQLHLAICATRGLQSIYDASGSIGRRYARADEVGIPYAITIDHQSMEDGTATIRSRDTQQQIRHSIDEIPDLISSGTVSSMFD